jgi:hypothetical protein
MLQTLNCFVAACGGLFLLSIFRRTTVVPLVPQVVVGPRPKSVGLRYRPACSQNDPLQQNTNGRLNA